MNRRKFLAGAIAAAVAPSVAFTPMIRFEPSMLGGYQLVRGYERYEELYYYTNSAAELYKDTGVDEGPYND